VVNYTQEGRVASNVADQATLPGSALAGAVTGADGWVALAKLTKELFQQEAF